MFKNENYLYKIKRNANENTDVYMDRVNFVISQNPRNIKEYTEASIYANIHVNVQYLGCEYDEAIMEQLQKMRDNCTISSS